MAVQFDEMVDALIVLHPDYESILLFDNFYWSRKKRVYSIGTLSMNRVFGGAQPHVKFSKIH